MTEVTETVSVKSADGKRTYFEGTAEDAETFIVNNFPRIHVEPGVNYGEDGPEPDAYIAHADGSSSWFDGADWYSDAEDDTSADAAPAVIDKDHRPANSADKADWVTYAKAWGGADDIGDRMTKKQLIDEYGGE